MPESTLQIESSHAVARIWMSRPAVHNALNEAMIDELTDAFATLDADSTVRVIALCGRGKSFSAGADIDSMRRQGAASYEDNLAQARQLAAMFDAIASATKPTIARVHGAAIGGGLGLVAACDIAIAADHAAFAVSEVRLGIIPSTIAPYVLRAIGPRNARRLFQTGERFDGQQALRIGLVHESVNADQLDARIDAVIEHLLAGAPSAQSAAKELVDAVAYQPITPALMEETALGIARIRSEQEAREGLSAFLEKRAAAWVKPQ
jgi:methylglutaconyl-CoA hydratase